VIGVRREDLVTADVDCILRSVGSNLMPLTAVGREVGAAAGEGLLARVAQIGDLTVGGAVITPAGNLCASFIVHVALQSKEIRVFFRDTTQWSQLILLAVLVVVYVYNIKVLPLNTGEELPFYLINLVSFLNLGLAGFVVAAIAARFVFPGMSLEGRMMWLLRSSPLDIRTLFMAKYWVGTLPLLVIALPLIVGTNIILEASPLILGITTASMIGITFAMTALALGLGAIFPNCETDNTAETPTSFGGLICMMSAVSYLAVVVILLAWPVNGFLQARLAGEAGAFGITPLVLGATGALVITVACVVLPLRAGIRRVRSLQ
jgi:ABC-2 type transport system permease protein